MAANRERKILDAIAKVSDTADKIDIVTKLRGAVMPADDSTFYPVVKEYCTGNLKVEDAVNRLLDPIDNASLKGEQENTNIMDLWYSIFHSAKRTSFSNTEGHAKLIELLKKIKAREEPVNRSGEKIYANLRNFSLATRETMNDGPGVGMGYLEPEVLAHWNINYFYALVTKERLSDLWISVIWVMRDALEQPQSDDGPHDAHIPGTALQKYHALVPAAAVWVFGLGRVLYEKEQDLTPERSNQGSPGRGGQLWKGKAEFSRARWTFWKNRFDEIGGMEKLDQDTRNIASRAVESMNACEYDH